MLEVLLHFSAGVDRTETETCSIEVSIGESAGVSLRTGVTRVLLSRLIMLSVEIYLRPRI